MKQSTYVALWIISGLVTGVSLLIPLGWMLALFALMLQLILLQQRASLAQLFFCAWLSGTLHMLVVLAPLLEISPPVTLGLSVQVALLMAVAVWFLSALVIGVGLAISYVTLMHISIKARQHVWWLFPLFLLLAELLGRLFFSLLSLAEFGGLNVAFGFGQIGFVLAQHPLLVFLAIGGGVYMLTLVSGGIASFLLYLYQKKNWSMFLVAIGLLLSTTFMSFSVELPEQLMSVAVLLTDTTSERGVTVGFVDGQDIREQILQEAHHRQITTLIVPEDSRFLPSIFEREMGAVSYADMNITVIDTSRVDDAAGAVQSAFSYDAASKNVYSHDKQYFVPLGEYVPLLANVLLRAIGMGDVVDEAEQAFKYHPGQTLSVEVYKKTLPPVLFCFESIVPYYVWQLRQQSSWPYIAHVVSHAWFPDTYGRLKYQLGSMLTVQAVGARMYIVQAGNKAPGALYTPNGQQFVRPLAQDALWEVVRVADMITKQ